MGAGQGVGLGGQDGCERRIEVFCENSKTNRGGGGREGVRVDVNEELKVFVKIKKKSGVGGSGRGVGLGVRVDVNEELKFL